MAGIKNSTWAALAGLVLAALAGLGLLWLTDRPQLPPDFESLPDRQGSRHGLKLANAHEHLAGPAAADRLLAAMDAVKVERTVLVGSPRYTLGEGPPGFAGWAENNEALLSLAAARPGRFVVFPTLDPLAPDHLERLEDYLARGARGLKLYLGHGGAGDDWAFHVMPLDDARLDPLYARCAARELPLLFHVNLHLYQAELERVLARHPGLRLILPHFGLLAQDPARLAGLLERHPRLLIDISFGETRFLAEGLDRIGRRREEFRALFARFADRILFGTDAVVTAAPARDREFLERNLQAYVGLLEERWFRLELEGRREVRAGLELPPAILRRVYRENLQELLDGTAAD